MLHQFCWDLLAELGLSWTWLSQSRHPRSSSSNKELAKIGGNHKPFKIALITSSAATRLEMDLSSSIGTSAFEGKP
jgi:hypothetical protein